MSLFNLLHLSDPTLPIGGFSHSAGLETYVQLGIVNDFNSAKEFVVEMLTHNVQFNDAAFVYYVGYFRYRYFNLANRDYKPSEDGALLGSLKYVIGEPINLFLRSDINNFIKITN